MIRTYADKVRWKYLRLVSRGHARALVDRIARMPCGPFEKLPPEGYQRGIDYFDRIQLIRTVGNILAWYRYTSGESLNLLEPRCFSEKLNHAKLFAAMKVPETGNKSLTASFIPDHLRDVVRYPDIVWRSRVAELPDNGEIPAGVYYLKTNHGSGWVRRIEYPLSPAAKTALEGEFAAFLLTDYGVELGEWWYNVFDRELILEKAVSRSGPSTALLFTVIDGEVSSISVDQKALDKNGTTRVLSFDGEFVLRESQRSESELVIDFDLSAQLKQKTLEVAREIGKQFECMRVDLMVGDDSRIYLNELTPMSNCGHPLRNRELDRELGKRWSGEIYRVTR